MEPTVDFKLFQLKDEHREHLLKSGISAEVIDTRRYWSADDKHKDMLRVLGLGSFANRLPGLVMPIFGTDGEQSSAQLRLDNAVSGMRYASPAKSERPVTMDIHPNGIKHLDDVSVDLWVTEGIKKADALTSLGLFAVALMGVTMWTKKDEKGSVAALPEWDSIVLKERNVYIVFDSDVATKKQVEKALFKLKTLLEGRGAFVHVMYLPTDWKKLEPVSGDYVPVKVGVDDFIAAGKGVSDLYSLPTVKPTASDEDPKLLEALNSQLIVLEEPAGAILYDNGDTFQLRSPGELNTLFAAYKAPGDKGTAISWWLRQPNRRQCRKVVFKPGQPADVGGNYNLWREWAVNPVKKDITLFWDFVREVICANDNERYVYLRKWMAHAVQKPAELPRAALLLHSPEGTGKGMFMDWFKPLFGVHYFEVTSLENAIGHFNAHLGRSMLVFANEAVWGGDKRQQGRMKALITDATSDVTSKGKDTMMIDNFKRWVFASNADSPVPIDRSDRRFVVFEVSTCRKGQNDYYKALENLRDREGGVAALMYDLLHEDITGFNPATRPTSGLLRYKQMTASPFDAWLQSCLTEAEIRCEYMKHDCYEPWAGNIPKNTIYDAYLNVCKGMRGEKLSANSFWDKMREVGAVGDSSKKDKKAKAADGSYTRVVELTPLADARKAFATYMSEDPKTLWEHAAALPGPCEHASHSAKQPGMPESERNF